MTVFDYTVLVIIGISLLLGVLRGAIKEVLSLVGWVAAFFIANAFAPDLARELTRIVTNPPLRTVVAYIVLFVVTLLVVGVLKFALSELIKTVGLSGFDRVLGAVVGIGRGIVIVLILVLVCGMTTMPQEPFWRQAMSAKWFETIAITVKPWLPDEISKRINFLHP